jgi:hypothetical protein
MAARGWLVLRPNYRGSPNLGYVYQHAILYDPRTVLERTSCRRSMQFARAASSMIRASRSAVGRTAAS